MCPSFDTRLRLELSLWIKTRNVYNDWRFVENSQSSFVRIPRQWFIPNREAQHKCSNKNERQHAIHSAFCRGLLLGGRLGIIIIRTTVAVWEQRTPVVCFRRHWIAYIRWGWQLCCDGVSSIVARFVDGVTDLSRNNDIFERNWRWRKKLKSRQW